MTILEIFPREVKMLFSCRGEHTRWLQPTQGEIDINIRNIHWGVPHPNQMRGQTGAARWEAAGGGRMGGRGLKLEPDWSRGQMEALSGAPSPIWHPISYLVLHPLYLVPHPLSGTPYPIWYSIPYLVPPIWYPI